MYYRARWYDPQVGRFISEDPIGFAGGLNWYAYLQNRSINNRDPFGLHFPESSGETVPPLPSQPSTIDNFFGFLTNYFFGSGNSTSLSESGVGGDYENSDSTRAAIEKYRQSLERGKDQALTCYCEWQKQQSVYQEFPVEYFERNFSTNTTWESPGLFVLGRSRLSVRSRCQLAAECRSRTYSFDCTSDFLLTDSFEDPLDGERFDYPFDLPTSQPYPLRYRFKRQFNFMGGF
jgi:hypothetical protein